MIPGLGAARRQLTAEAIDESQIKKLEAIIRSMTPQERHNPQIIDGSRRRRIARGSGTTTQDVNQLLNQWRQARKLIESMSGRRDMARLFR
jgi:signal recognition particle subunit SRP54